MVTNAENELLTRTDRGTPLGDFARRYWFPAFPSDKVGGPDSDPVAVRLLGEDLVAFRDADGRVGILDRYCPHRLASLVLARNENCALQCVYHGWRIAADGTVLETPPEPVNSKFAQSVRQTSYPTREVNGMVWVYMGPPELTPPFPAFPMLTVPEENLVSACVRNQCNFMQAVEADMDAAHAGWLHYGGMGHQILPPARHLRAQLTDPRPRTAHRVEPWGLQSMMRWETDVDGEVFCSIHPLVMPFFTMAAYHTDDGARFGGGHAFVPIDDHNHYSWTWLWSTETGFPPELRAGMTQAFMFGVSPEDDYLHKDYRPEGYVQDRAAMRARTSFSGLDGASAQDLGVLYSMGRIVDRTREHLASEDALVVQTRRYYLKTLSAFSASEGPLPALEPGFDHASIDHRAVIVPSEVPTDEIFDRREWVNVVTG